MFDGEEAFSGTEGTNLEFFFWIPILGPLFGGLAGMFDIRP